MRGSVGLATGAFEQRGDADATMDVLEWSFRIGVECACVRGVSGNGVLRLSLRLRNEMDTENPARQTHFFGTGLGMPTWAAASGRAWSGLGHVPIGESLGSAVVGSAATAGSDCGVWGHRVRPARCDSKCATIPPWIDASGIGRSGEARSRGSAPGATALRGDAARPRPKPATKRMSERSNWHHRTASGSPIRHRGSAWAIA
jgi:hypothetical protein